MMKKLLCAVLLLPFCELSAELPDTAALELDQLGKWETQHLEHYREKLKIRRAESIGALKVYLAMAKKAQDREGAAEIQDQIKRLRKAGGSLANAGAVASSGKPKNDEQVRKHLSGTSWEFSGGKVITLQEDGSVLKSWGKLQPDWRVVDGKVRFEGKLLIFNENFTEVSEATAIEFKESGKLVVLSDD